ncbi:MAG: phosphatidylserine decarboxylase [Bdellovibrionaceae bacterium]|nr:phosphatidylserine decarboxylase [Pseudobdellovibrionaceae bacterium]
MKTESLNYEAVEASSKSSVSNPVVVIIYEIAYVFYASIISSYFLCLLLLSVLKIKPPINLVESPDFISMRLVRFWNLFPARLKIWLSKQNKRLFESSFTQFYIRGYIHRNYIDPNYLNQFTPSNQNSQFRSFQDFFTRDFIKRQKITTKYASPCEGLLCDKTTFKENRVSNVKGEKIGMRDIFGRSASRIPSDYHFFNIFLSNRNYHHIHAPVSGKVTGIERMAGDLIVLRPWYYKKNPSLPAFLNERVNVNILDSDGRTWFLSIVGGPVVNSILFEDFISLGSQIEVGDKIATFELGSTCCVASPLEFEVQNLTSVEVFQPLKKEL